MSFPYHVDDHIPLPAPQKLDSDTLCAKVIRSGQALLLTPDDDAGLPEDSGHHSQARVGNCSRSWLGVPLESQNRTIGALMVQSNADNAQYTKDDQELLQFVSNQIAAAIERKQMIASLQHTALYDRLTQLPNRDCSTIACNWR